MKEIAIDLLWLRPKKVGGTEFYIRNLLDGLMQLKEPFRFVLVTAKDNADTFTHYLTDKRFRMLTVPIESEKIGKRLIWQNLFENRLLKKNGLRLCFSPVFFRPFLNGGVSWMNTIHDIQAYHYPKYHPFYEVAYSWLCWYANRLFSKKVVVISEYVKQDLVEHFHFKPEKIEVIYNPVAVEEPKEDVFEGLRQKYGVEKGEYYYTLSQLIPHKNLVTLVSVMERVCREHAKLPQKLLISGVSGFQSDKLKELIREKHLEQAICLTGFVENSEKFSLLKNCRAFLFPSVFEGFGMPPVEAMLLGTPVITTRCTCIPEVTQNMAHYVEDPYRVEDWIAQMKKNPSGENTLDASVYDKERISRQYLECILDFAKEGGRP